MARILALDYGTKRTGIAVTDELKMIASGLTTVHTPDLIKFLDEYFKNENVERVLVGEPKRMDDTPSQSEVHIQKFLKQFTKKFPDMPLERVDERFTSKMAVQSMIDGGLKKKKRRDKALVDEISATIILQTWLYEKLMTYDQCREILNEAKELTAIFVSSRKTAEKTDKRS